MRTKGTKMNQKHKSSGSKNGKESKQKFSSKTVKHDPQAESARAVFGLKDSAPEERD